MAQADKYGTLWNRDELILALYLYCQIPFAQTTIRNPEVVKLAGLIGRTPASIARKLGNFGAFDPLLAKQGISGLVNYSKAAQAVWNEFYNKWDMLVEESVRVLAQSRTDFIVSSEEEKVFVRPTGATGKSQVVTVRLYQSFFRRSVLSSYQNQC